MSAATSRPHTPSCRRAGRRTPRQRRSPLRAAAEGAEEAGPAGGAGAYMPGRETLPALCFGIGEPFLPGSRKRLHLFEARTLGAAEDAVARCGGLLAHICVADRGGGRAGVVPVASLARVDSLRRMDIGCEVEIVCEGRLMLEDAMQESDGGFLTAMCHDVPHPSTDPHAPVPLPDEAQTATLKAEAGQLDKTLADVMSLALRLTGGAEGATDADADDDEGDTAESEDADDGMLWGHAETSSLQSALDWAARRRPVSIADLQTARAMAGDEAVTADSAPWKLEEREQAERLAAAAERAGAVIAEATTEEGAADADEPLSGPALSAYSALAPTVEDAARWSELVYAERLSFAALQLAPASSMNDEDILRQARSRALALVEGAGAGLEARLKLANSVAEEQLKTLRAKVALLALDA